MSVFADDSYDASGYTGQSVGYQYDLFSFGERQKFQAIGSNGGGSGGTGGGGVGGAG